MVDGFYRSVVKELKALGFRYDINAKGGHEKWVNDNGLVLIVPFNLMSRHTANAILKDAGSTLKL